ncbi:hypothetical protein ACJX0J_039461, partial [Zea mays]
KYANLSRIKPHLLTIFYKLVNLTHKFIVLVNPNFLEEIIKHKLEDELVNRGLTQSSSHWGHMP